MMSNLVLSQFKTKASHLHGWALTLHWNNVWYDFDVMLSHVQTDINPIYRNPIKALLFAILV